jgi:hypothetical protein
MIRLTDEQWERIRMHFLVILFSDFEIGRGRAGPKLTAVIRTAAPLVLVQALPRRSLCQRGRPLLGGATTPPQPQGWYSLWRSITAQAIRAVLFASARGPPAAAAADAARSHGSALVAFDRSRLALAPLISSRRAGAPAARGPRAAAAGDVGHRAARRPYSRKAAVPHRIPSRSQTGRLMI